MALSTTIGGIAIFCVAFRMVSRARSILSLNFVPGGRDKLKFWEAFHERKMNYREDKAKYNAYLEKNWNMDQVDSHYRWIKKENKDLRQKKDQKEIKEDLI